MKNKSKDLRVSKVKQRSFLSDKRQQAGVLFLLPGFLFVFVFMIYPLFYSFFLSFTEYNFVFDDRPRFVGFGNYIKMFSDTYFIDSFRNTLFFMIVFLPSIMLFSFLIALLLDKQVLGTGFFRTSIFLPVIVPLSLTGIIFQWILNNDYGLLNHFLRNILGVPSLAKDWLTDSKWAMYSIIFVSVWKFMGVLVILFVAGLQGIPRELYEAGTIDGCTRFKSLLYITIPNLRETYVITGIWAVIQAVKVFEQAFIMTGGGPGTSTLVLYLYVWRSAFMNYDMGYASAIAYVMALIILIISLVNLRINRTENN